MNALQWTVCLVLFICQGLLDHINAQSKARVSTVTCSSVGHECDTIGNATCDNTNCQCKAGFQEDGNNGSTCVKIIGGSCTGSAACPGDANTVCKNSKCACAENYGEKSNVCVASPTQISKVTCSTQGTECKDIPFSICVSNNCQCKDGYKEDSKGGSTCIKVLGTDCTGNIACPGATHSACIDSKCTCNTHYGERDGACKQLLNTVQCTAQDTKVCGGVENTECENNKCKCVAGFKMNVDVCMAENGSNTMKLKLLIFALPIVITTLEAIKMVM